MTCHLPSLPLVEGRGVAGPWLRVGGPSDCSLHLPVHREGFGARRAAVRATWHLLWPEWPTEAEGQEQGAAHWPQPLPAEGGHPRGSHPGRSCHEAKNAKASGAARHPQPDGGIGGREAPKFPAQPTTQH